MMLVDEEGVPCIVQKITYSDNGYYFFTYFDGTHLWLRGRYVKNHHQVVHSLSQTGYYNFQPIIEQLEQLYKENKKLGAMDRS